MAVAAFRRFAAVLLPTGLLCRGKSTGFGYRSGVGVGSTVTQLTSRSTGVTINALSGTITTHNASLAAEGSVDFVVTNSRVSARDVVVISIKGGSNGVGTLVNVVTVADGSFTIRTHNGNLAAGGAETGAIEINFVVVKGTAN